MRGQAIPTYHIFLVSMQGMYVCIIIAQLFLLLFVFNDAAEDITVLVFRNSKIPTATAN